MKKLLFLLMGMAATVAGFAQATIRNHLSNHQVPPYIEQPADAAGIYAIYPGSGIPELSKKWTWHEQSTTINDGKMAQNVALPTVTVFRPEKGKETGTSVIVLPGGAFYVLMMNKEGYSLAVCAGRISGKPFDRQ